MLTWQDDETLEIGGIEYLCRPGGRRFKSEPGRFCLLKARAEVEQFEQLLRALEPRRIFEVGMYDGASAALFAEIARPDRLITVDRRATPSDALLHFIAARGFETVVQPFCGIDQGNTIRLREVLHDALGSEQLDLVIDDASHLVDLTRRTFNCLFPRLRPGATYVIEDWSWAHTATAGPWMTTDNAPLTVFIFELILACAHAPRVVTNVNVFGNLALITRGDAELDRETFDISTCYGSKGRALVPGLGVPTTGSAPGSVSTLSELRTDRWALAAPMPELEPRPVRT